MRSTGTGSLLLTAMIMVLLVLTAAIPVSGLYYWEQVSEEGFGDLSNDYPWSMAVYKPPGESTDYLYVGTLNSQYSEPPNLINDGCEIWRTDGTTYDILPKNLDVIKTVWDPEAQAWVQELDAFVNDTVRFRCEIRNIGSSNLTDIVVWNDLSRNLKYADRATIDPARISVSIKGRTTLEWDISDLSPGENIAIEYDANVTNYASNDLNFLFARGWSKDHWDTDWDLVIVNSTAIPECT